MGVALLNGVAFRLDPTSVGWDFTIKAAEIDTVGGKVAQIYGVDLGDMTVTGSFGRGGFAEQQAFLGRMKALADQQVKDAGKRNSTAQPFRFLYPSRGWDFLVYLKEYTQPDSSESVHVDPSIVNIEWSLTLFIAQDNAGLKSKIQDAYVARLAQGLGYVKKNSGYNGPVDNNAVQTFLQGHSQPDVGSAIASDFGIDPSVLSGVTN